jgi:SAM-dependent methyltransferase
LHVNEIGLGSSGSGKMSVSIEAIPPTVKRCEALVEWVLTDLNAQARVLEAGAGLGEWDFPAQIRERAQCLVGVDPDPVICRNPYLDEWHPMTLESFAQRETREFDVIYSHMLLEHVENPPAFLAAAWKLLKPAGTFFGVTPNLAHYFGVASYLAERLGIQEWLLRRLRGESLADAYHFRTAYQMNTIWTLRRLFRLVGAARLDLRMLEVPSDFACYFPRPLKLIPHLHSSLVYALGMHWFMGTILLRALKSP